MQGRFAYERVSWIETPTTQLAILGFALLLFQAVGVMVFASFLRRTSNGRLLVEWISALNLLFVVGLVIVLLPVASGGDIWQFLLEPSLALRVVLAIPLLTILLSLVLLVTSIKEWRTEQSSLVIRLLNVLVLVSIGFFVSFLHTWNLIGWRF